MKTPGTSLISTDRAITTRWEQMKFECSGICFCDPLTTEGIEAPGAPHSRGELYPLLELRFYPISRFLADGVKCCRRDYVVSCGERLRLLSKAAEAAPSETARPPPASF